MRQELPLNRLLLRQGAGLMAWVQSWWRIAEFAGTALVEVFSPSTYNTATRAVALRQIYFTAWQILPGFSIAAALLAYLLVRIIVATAQDVALPQFAVELSVRVVVLEIVPLFAALFIALRSGAAMNIEIALMNIDGELEALRRAGIDPMRFELVPRVLAASVSVVSLIIINCALALVITYLGVYGFTLWGLPEFTRAIGTVFDLQVAFGFALKCLFFGLAIAAIPISEGLAAERGAQAAPMAALRGMMRLFFALTAIEVVSLAVTYI